jgi:hypothetical protein
MPSVLVERHEHFDGALVMRKSRVRIPQAAPGTQRSWSRAVRCTGVGAGMSRQGDASETVLVASPQVVEFGFAGLGVPIKTDAAIVRESVRPHQGFASCAASVAEDQHDPVALARRLVLVWAAPGFESPYRSEAGEVLHARPARSGAHQPGGEVSRPAKSVS